MRLWERWREKSSGHPLLHLDMVFIEKPLAGKVLLDNMVPLSSVIKASQSLQAQGVLQRAMLVAKENGKRKLGAL